MTCCMNYIVVCCIINIMYVVCMYPLTARAAKFGRQPPTPAGDEYCLLVPPHSLHSLVVYEIQIQLWLAMEGSPLELI